MSAAFPLLVYTLWLTAGFAFVLWGLRIFKAWIALLGLSFGGALGASAAALAFGETQAMVIGGAVGALIGAVLAWPLQKLFVFLAAGSAGALLASVVAVALERADLLAPVAIGGFIVGGILMLALYETVIISAMAFTGAQAVFHAVFVPADAYAGSPFEVAERLLGIYADQVLPLAATTLLFVLFALWYQKGPARRRDPGDARWVSSLAARRVSFRLAALILATWVLTAVLTLRGHWNLSGFELAGMHALSWPLIVMATLAFLRPRPMAAVAASPALGEPPVAPPPRPRRSRRLLAAAAFCAVVPPLVTGALFVVYGAGWDTVTRYYLAFLDGPTSVLVSKWVLTGALMPALLLSAVPGRGRLTVPAPAPGPSEPPGPGSSPDPAGPTVPTEPAPAVRQAVA